MIITKVVIDNFKSIDRLEIPFDKVGDSYTKIFVGINESGKSNILEALSYFNVPTQSVSYDYYCNQKLVNGKSCSISFFLEYENEEDILKQHLLSRIRTKCSFDFTISNIRKYVFLLSNSTQFSYSYIYDVKLDGQKLYMLSLHNDGKDIIYVESEERKTFGVEEWNVDNFKKHFSKIINDFLINHEPAVSIWKPSSKDLLYNVNLNSLKNGTINKPLYNIFKLGGYENNKAITEVIGNISNPRSRSRLVSKLTGALNNFITKVWDNNIDLIVDITEAGNFSLLIKDKGEENIHDRFSISERSQGAQHFLSIILSLSLAAKNHEKRNELIVIDEPEVHLHPSGVRNLAHELLKIGQENYVFIATHSPFMIDKSHKERHCIVKKNSKAITELKWIKDGDDLNDDEVLRDAFGIDVYKDLLNPHRVLVEGATDKLLLKKALICLNHSSIGITNGCGSNITTLVSKFNYDNIKIVVVLDDDEDGRRDKEKILQVGGLYTDENVFTIRDLVSEIVDNGTIEDTLDQSFVVSQFEKFYKSKYNKASGFVIQSQRPILQQIIEFLKRDKHYSQWDMDAFKQQISEEYNPSKTALSTKHVLLEKLAKSIIEKLK